MKTKAAKMTLLYAALLLIVHALHAQVPQPLNYQGRFAVGTPPVNFDGTGAFKSALVSGDGSMTY